MAKPTAAEIASWTTEAQALAGITGAGLTTNSATCSDLTRCSDCKGTSRSSDCVALMGSTGCKGCVNSYALIACKYLEDCYECKDCQGKGEGPSYRARNMYLCEALEGCYNMIATNGVKGKNHMVCGVKVSPAVFDRVWALLLPTLQAKRAAVQ